MHVPVYLSPRSPRHQFEDEPSIRRAADGGLLEEGHFVDAKAMIPPGRHGNQELARDVASFAVDGGTLLVGVAEPEPGRFVLEPQELDGLPERIEQVAHSIPDPPVQVVTQVVRSDSDPSRGYLLVHIPPSPAAPHMVKGVYFGRGDKTRIQLSDQAVRNLHDRRKLTREVGTALLEAAIESDPITTDEQAHLFLIAAPAAGPPLMLADLVENASDWQQQLLALAQAGRPAEQGASGRWADMLSELSEFARTPEAIMLRSYGLRPDELAQRPGGTGAQLRLSTDGTISLYHSRLSAWLAPRGTSSAPRNAVSAMLFDTMLIGMVHQLLLLVGAVHARTGYMGNWIIAAGATGLRDVKSYLISQQYLGTYGVSYPEDTWKRVVEISYADVLAPRRAVCEVIGPFLRTLGSFESMLPHIDRLPG